MDENLNYNDILDDKRKVNLDDVGDAEVVSFEESESNTDVDKEKTDLNTFTSSDDEDKLIISEVSKEDLNVNKIVEKKLSVKTDGTIYIGDRLATNEELEVYLDYKSYSDKKTAKLVEMMLKNDKIDINGVIYEAKLNKNGEMVSVDGTKKFTQEEIMKYLGKKVYVALLCKTVKNVSLDEDGNVIVKDRDEKFEIKLSQPIEDTFLYDPSIIDLKKSKKLEDNIENGISSNGGNSNGYYNNSYVGGSPGGGYSNGGRSSSVSQSGVQAPVSKVIKVDFGQLKSISDEMTKLSGSLTEVSDGYQSTINSLRGSSVWTGEDKNVYVEKKTEYSNNLNDISKSLKEFADYLKECYDDYETLEKELAAKTIS